MFVILLWGYAIALHEKTPINKCVEEFTLVLSWCLGRFVDMYSSRDVMFFRRRKWPIQHYVLRTDPKTSRVVLSLRFLPLVACLCRTIFRGMTSNLVRNCCYTFYLTLD